MSRHHHHHHEGCQRRDAAQLLEQCLQRAKAAGLRRTAALHEVLALLLEACQPLTLADLSADPRLAALADRSTVYRLLVKLEQHALVRRVGLHDRAAYYHIHLPGEHHDYLICEGCGRIERLEQSCPVEALEQTLSAQSGFTNLKHDLTFYGLCPHCSSGSSQPCCDLVH